MLPLLELSVGEQRAAVLLVPFLIAGVAILVALPGTRTLAGIFVASLWNLTTLVLANLVALHMGWWTFNATGGLLLGLPFDVLLGWAVWWGAAGSARQRLAVGRGSRAHRLLPAGVARRQLHGA